MFYSLCKDKNLTSIRITLISFFSKLVSVLFIWFFSTTRSRIYTSSAKLCMHISFPILSKSSGMHELYLPKIYNKVWCYYINTWDGFDHEISKPPSSLSLSTLLKQKYATINNK
jgi:hypothetical protein